MSSFAEYHNKRNKTKINLDDNIVNINIEDEKEEESPFMKYHNEREKQEYEKKLRKKEYDDEEDTDTWFKKGAFDDGYQFGDLTKTVGSTVGDIGVGLGKGIFRLGEGVGDLISYGVADIQEWTGNEEAAEATRERTRQSITDEIFQPSEDFVDKNSVLGDKSDSITEGLGYVAGITAISIVSGGAGGALGVSSTAAATVGSTAATFTSAMGSGMSEALNDGATIEEARIYGAISGAGEAASELLFGGLGKASGALGLSKGFGELDDIIIGGMTKNIKNKMVKTVMQSGLKATGEGLEEIVSGLISSAGKKLTYMDEKEYSEIVKDENLAEQFWMGALTSAIAQGPSTIKSVKSGTDYITGRTSNEQRVYDSLRDSKTNEYKTQKTIDNMVNEQQTKLKELYGRELTTEEVNKIKEAVNETKETGRLNIEDTKLSAKEKAKIEEEIENDLAEGNLSLETIRDILGENVDLSKDNLLQRSLYENSQKYEDYKVELTGNEKVDNFLKSAAEAGVNNTTKTRKRIELISKLVENTDRNYRFVNQEQLKENGYNENANGLNDNGDILLNVNSNKEIVAVVGHETTHLFDSKVNGEYTQEYKDLQDAVKNYLQANGTYEAKINEIMDTYNKAGINLTQDQIMEELTADTIGDNLFGDNAEEFIKHLTTNRTVFQKIYDYIKKAVVNIKGYKSEEARQLQNLKDAFDRVYKTLDTTGINADTKYSIQQNEQGQKYIKVDTDQDIFDGIDEKDYNKIAKMYMQDYLKGKTELGENDIANIGNKGISKYTNPIQKAKYITEKMQLTPELKNVLSIAEKVDNSLPTKDTSKYPNWEYYKFKFELSGKTFEGLINIGIDKNGNKHFYEINKIHTTSNSYVSTNKFSSTDSINNSIPSSNKDVNTTKYSIQNNENNTQDNQGRTLSKQQQEYFKDSKILDRNGLLMTVYHGTGEDFNIFDINNISKNTKNAGFYGDGFYFTPIKESARYYGKNIKEVYLDIKNPFSFSELSKYNGQDYYTDYVQIANLVKLNKEWGQIPVKFNSHQTWQDIRNDVQHMLENNNTDEEIDNAMYEKYGEITEKINDRIYNYSQKNGWKSLRDILTKNGYDGIINSDTPANSSEIIAFNTNQIKNVDNTNPTSNPDIRYSLSEDTQESRLAKLNEDFDLYDKTREDLYERRDNVRKQYDEIINSQDYKEALKKVTSMSDVNEVTKTNEYQLLVKAQRLKNQINDYQDEIDIASKELRRISQEIDKEEQQHRNPKEAIRQAKKQLGLTDNFKEAGYMLEDGSLLDFSGRNYGSGAYNKRTIDHREINEFGYEMREFIELGNIRMQPESNGFELMKEPTLKQYKMLKEYIDNANGEVFIDVYKDNKMHSYDNANYKFGTSSSKIINDLQYYFRNGEFPKQSELSQFRYSLTKGETDQYWKKLDKSDLEEYNTIESEVGNNGEQQIRSENDRLQEKPVEELAAGNTEVYERIKELNRNIKREVAGERARLNDLVSEQLSELPISKTKTEKFVRELANNKVMTQEDIRNFIESNNKYIEKDINEYLQSIRKDISSYSFKLNDGIKSELRYTYDKIPRNIKLRNDGLSVDQVYQELSSKYPDIFSSEIINEVDQATEIIDFMRDVNPISTNETTIFNDEEINEASMLIYAYKQNYDEAKKYYGQYFLDEKKKIQDLSPKNIQENNTPKKLTRKMVREQILQEMNIKDSDLQAGKDISSINFQLSDPIRVNEKVFGREIGQKINDLTINQTKHHTAEKIRWQNKERVEIKDLGIKARSKESAAVQKYGEKQYVDKNGNIREYGEVQLAHDFPNVKTQEKIKNAARVIRGKYDTYIEQINDVLTALGYDAIPKRQDYMRHFQELGDIFSKTGVPFNLNDMSAENLPTDINGLTEFNRPGKNWFAQAQKRYGEKTSYDAITGIDGYLEGAGNLIFHTQDIQNYRAVSSLIRDTFGATKGFDKLEGLSDAEAQQRIADIQDNKLSRYVAWLDEQANNLAGKKGAIDRGVERFLGRKAYTFFNTIKKQVGSNMTGLNVRSSLTNLISSTIAAGKTNKIALAKGTMSTINNMLHNDGFIDKSDFLTSRFGSDTLSNKLWQKVSNAGQIFMNGTDYFTANIITRSKYYEGLQKGMTETEAIKYADDFASRVMGDRSQGATAEAFNSKTLGLFTQFQLEVNNQWQYMIHDTKMDYQKNSEINGGLKAGATALFQLGQIAAYSYFFNELFEKATGNRAAFDPIEIFKTLFGLDDDDEDKSFDERLSKAGETLVDNIPFGNLITGGGRIPISEAFTGLSTLGKKLTNQKDKYGGEITWEDVGKDTIKALPYWVLPTGYSQINKTSKGLGMYNDNLPVSGSYTDSGNLRYTVEDSVGSKVQAALFGAYANPYAQDYIDSGFKAIKQENIDEMVGLDMNSTEYREFKSNMSKVSDTSDKNGYKQYIDENNNVYWYDANSETMYDSKYKKTTLTEDDLIKVSKKEQALNYINSLDLTTAQKNLAANNLNKNSKKKIDMAEYGNYDSYDEYQYARDYPEKYNVIKQIGSFDEYNEYYDAISEISKKYKELNEDATDKEKTRNSKYKKQEIQSYINGLDLNMYQKMMLEKMAGGYSIKKYQNYIYEYLETTGLSESEKYTIWEELFE